MVIISHEQDLIAQLKKGDKAAFESLLDVVEKPVYRLIFGIIRQEEDAADLAQDVLVKVYENIHAFRGQSSLYHWISRIAVNRCRNFLRRKKIVRFISMDWLLETQGQDFEDTKTHFETEKHGLKDDPLSPLSKALSTLSIKDQELIILSEVNDLSYDAIATILNVPLGTVKSRLFRAKQALKTTLLKGGYDEEK